MAVEDAFGKILAEALYVVREQVALPSLVNRQTVQDMSSPQTRGGIVWFEVPPDYTARDVVPGVTSPAHSTPTRESSAVQCPLDYWKEVDFELTDKELALLDNPQAHPMMKIRSAAGEIGAQISASIAAQYTGVYGWAGTAGTTPFASAPTAAQAARTVLTNQQCPRMMRQMVLDPDAYGNAIALPQMAADQRGDGASAAYINGTVPRTMGFDWSEDLMVASHTTSGGAGWLVNQADHAIGDTTVTIDTGSGAPGVGDVFTVAGDNQTYVVTAYAANVITYAPAAVTAFADNAAITFKASHVVNLAFHPFAFGFASAPELISAGPDGRRPALTMIDEMTDIALTLEVKREHHQWGYYLSCLWGTKLVDARLAVRVAG